MRKLTLLVGLLPCLVSAAWIETKSGPFVVYSDAGDDNARAALYHLEQFRFIFGEAIGRRELKCVWPVTVIVSKPGKNPKPPMLGFSRAGWLATWPAGSAPPAAWFKQLALVFLEDNLQGRMAGDLESSIASLFSTMEISKGKVTLGIPPVAAERTRSWAMVQYLMTNVETAVRTKVLLSNLAGGGDEGAAFRNAFEKPKAAIDGEVDKYYAAGQFATVTLPAKPMDPDRQFSIIPLLPSRLRVVAGDELMARGAAPAEIRAAYQHAINERPGPLAWEGLGLALLLEKQPEEARKALEQMALDAEGSGARGLLELGQFDKASLKNPLWAEPYVRAAMKEPGPVRRAYFYKKVVELAPRHAEYWRELAKTQFDLKQFAEAERSWRAAERVARDEAERTELTRAREEFQQMRYDAEAAERARLKKEEADEVERVRRQQMESIRKAEEAANAAGGGVPKKAEKWWDGPPTQTFVGTLDGVACQGAKARLNARGADGKPVVFVIADPAKVVVFAGGGQTTTQLGCGPQKPARRVKIEYVAKPGGGPGEVATVEFQ